MSSDRPEGGNEVLSVLVCFDLGVTGLLFLIFFFFFLVEGLFAFDKIEGIDTMGLNTPRT